MVEILCICPPRDGLPRHLEGDTVTLRDKLDFTGALAVRNVMRLREDGDGMGDILAALTEAYLCYGVEAWSLVDENDVPIDVDREAIRKYLLANPLQAFKVGDEADGLYTEAVVSPLLAGALTSSAATPIETSTSPQTGYQTTPPMPSLPSSTSTSPTDDIETTSRSLAGVSS